MGKILAIALVLCAAVSLTLGSCDTGGCTELRSAVPRADFFSSADNNKITLDSLEITGVGVPGDSLLYDAKQRLSQVYLPMPPLADAVQWRIAYAARQFAEIGLADTISLRYDRTPWFAGEECGAMYKYRITDLAYTTALIDSVVIADSLVINVDQATLSIYFRTE